MSAETNRPRRYRHIKPRPMFLAGQQPLGWSFNQIKQVETAIDTPSVRSTHEDTTNEKMFDAESELSKYSSTSSGLFQSAHTGTQDTDMPDAPPLNKVSSIDKKIKSAAPAITPSSQDSPVVWVNDEGEVVEELGSRFIGDELDAARAKENLIKPNTNNYPLQQASMESYATVKSNSHCYRLNSPQTYPKTDQSQKLSLPFGYSSSSSREPDVEILDAAIARNFPVYQKGKHAPHDYLSDAGFAQGAKGKSLASPLEIDDDEEPAPEDFASEDFLVEHLRTLVISPSKQYSLGPQKITSRPRRFEVRAARHKKFYLEKGVTVELHSGSFLWIQSVWRQHSNQITIQGYRLLRYEHCGSKLPDQRQNELVWFSKIDEDQYGIGSESVLGEESVVNLKRVRNVIYTNRPWPEISYTSELESRGSRRRDVDRATPKESGILYCRWKYIEVQTRFKTDAEACLTLLNEDEARDIGWLRTSEVRRQWRGDDGPIPGGSSTRSIFNVDNRKMTSLQKYSTGDCFCGAGGISRGAFQAGLHVAWGFDKDSDAIETHNKNFARCGTLSLTMNDAQFLNMIKNNPEKYVVDHAHYSPPCQPFSAANHNRNVEGDFINQKTLFSLHHLTERLKPRVVTIEETAGLMNRHQEWFNTVINIFTSLGYSVRWKIVRCEDHGIAQKRVRLLLTAAAPGEKLPRFPKATHGERSSLKPYVKIRDVIYNIPPSATHQDMISESRSPELLTPFADDSFAKCITTGGGQNNHHPLGGRKYNVRELACLQGFPTNHAFSTKSIGVATRQVGNAVPPLLCKPWFEEIIKSLKQTDGIET